MKPLTLKEQQFILETGVTPTVIQLDEWNRTTFKDELPSDRVATQAELDKIFAHACTYAKQKYGINLNDLMTKCQLECDGISLELEAPYILWALKGTDLISMTAAEVLQTLKNWKYYCGFRKWDEEDAAIAREEALGIGFGTKIVTTFDDGSINIIDKDQ